MGGGGEPVAPPGRRGVFAGEGGHGGADLFGEGVEIGGGGEGDVGLDGQGEQARAFGGRLLAHAGDIANHGGGRRDQMVRGVTVLGLDRVRVGRRLHQAGVEDMVPRRDEQPFGEAALAALSGQLDEARGLQGIEVIADVLTRQAQLFRQTRGRGRLGQGRQDAAANGGQRQQGGVQIVEQGRGAGRHDVRLH
jgi:hypothetical protein